MTTDVNRTSLLEDFKVETGFESIVGLFSNPDLFMYNDSLNFTCELCIAGLQDLFPLSVSHFSCPTYCSAKGERLHQPSG